MDVPPEPEEPTPELPERQPRASVMLKATVEHFGGGAATLHRVRDLSPGGIRIDLASDFRVGSTVLISVGALEAVGATVRWVSEGSAGLAFAEMIDPAEARSKAAIAPRSKTVAAITASTACKSEVGWIPSLQSPYDK